MQKGVGMSSLTAGLSATARQSCLPSAYIHLIPKAVYRTSEHATGTMPALPSAQIAFHSHLAPVNRAHQHRPPPIGRVIIEIHAILAHAKDISD